jgi:hypothetical protein
MRAASSDACEYIDQDETHDQGEDRMSDHDRDKERAIQARQAIAAARATHEAAIAELDKAAAAMGDAASQDNVDNGLIDYRTATPAEVKTGLRKLGMSTRIKNLGEN